MTPPMPPPAVESLAVTALVVVGGFCGLLAYDAVKWLLAGNTGTISHGFWILSGWFWWLAGSATTAAVALVLGLGWHFWSTKPPKNEDGV